MGWKGGRAASAKITEQISNLWGSGVCAREIVMQNAENLGILSMQNAENLAILSFLSGFWGGGHAPPPLEPPVYQTAHLPTINEIKMIEKVERLHQEYVGLKKLNPDRRLQNPKVKSFREKLLTTMPFWLDDIEKKLEENK